MNSTRRTWLTAGLAASVSLALGRAHAGSFEDFFVAVRRDDARTIQTLLARGFDPNTVDETGQPALMLAFNLESYRAMEALLKSTQIKAELRNARGESLLMLAAIKGDLRLAKWLIDGGADVNKTGWTPLHYACSGTSPQQADMARLLLENSAYIDAESPNGSTPLMMAAMYGTTDTLTLLLAEGADASLRNQQGLTAIEFAQRVGRSSNVEAIAAALRKRQPKGTW